MRPGPTAIGLDITFTDEDRGSEAASMGEAAEALGLAVAGLPEPSRQPFTPVLARLRASASRGGDDALARALAAAPELVQGVSAYGTAEDARTTPGSARSPRRSSGRAC